ncbi:hypothetical protein [Chryseobacterium sp. GP-SGM7]|uniref:hypothetical protein n=1 Tax=Chryseobacterium sp. GP-SGM7 TaxID=3411323 RepID=UPI003B92DBD7
MRNIFLIMCFISLISCSKTDYKEKFSNLEKKNFSDFTGYSITYRNGSYLISNANIEKDDKRVFVKRGMTGKVKYIKDINNNIVTKSDFDIKSLEKMLNKFDNLDVANLSVDNFENVQFAFFLDKCSYTFLHLSTKRNLKDLNKTYFEKYKDNWYLYKQCSK